MRPPGPAGPARVADRLRGLATHRRLPWLLAALSMLLSANAVGIGLQLDDHYLRLALSDPPIDPDWSRSPLEVFSFFSGDADFTRRARDRGVVPWWAAEELKLAFFRPLTGLTHWLDFRLWPERPGLMHVQSLLWLGAGVAAATLLFRQLPLPPVTAGVAALLFAVDDAHGFPAAWVANRNALVAALLGILAIAAHDRWRRAGWRPGALAAPLLLLLGLLGGETALGTGGYLLGHAVFLDRGSWRRRLAALAPCGAVGVVWALGYRAFGYGSEASILYVDPGHPTEFLPALAERGPLLFFGLWALPSELGSLLSPVAASGMWVGCVGFAILVVALLWPLLRRDAVARFLASGTVLALIPAAATFPNNRLLVLSGLGAAGLLAQWLAMVRRQDGLPGAPWRPLWRFALWPAVVLHLLVSPLLLLGAAESVRSLGKLAERGAESLPRDLTTSARQTLVVNTPTAFITAQSALLRGLEEGRSIGARLMVLGSGLGATRVRRLDESTLAVQVEGGFLAQRAPQGDGPPFSVRNVLRPFDRLYRGASGFRKGERIPLTGLEVVLASVTPDGRPDEVHFRFDRPLEAPGLRWLQWKDGRYVPFDVPRPGQSVLLPEVGIPGF